MKLTEAAADKVAELLVEEGDPDLFLRVQVRPGGCAGFSYEMFFDTARTYGDLTCEHPTSHGTTVAVVVDPISAELLADATVDHQGGLTGGFKITNPAAKRSCGCGKSFC